MLHVNSCIYDPQTQIAMDEIYGLKPLVPGYRIP